MQYNGAIFNQKLKSEILLETIIKYINFVKYVEDGRARRRHGNLFSALPRETKRKSKSEEAGITSSLCYIQKDQHVMSQLEG